MITEKNLREALDILKKANSNIGHKECIEIWGEQLGEHIWVQDKFDIIKIWKSGFTTDESDALIKYLTKKYQDKTPQTTIDDLTESIYYHYGSGTGVLFGISADLKPAVKAIIKIVRESI